MSLRYILSVVSRDHATRRVGSSQFKVRARELVEHARCASQEAVSESFCRICSESSGYGCVIPPRLEKNRSLAPESRSLGEGFGDERQNEARDQELTTLRDKQLSRELEFQVAPQWLSHLDPTSAPLVKTPPKSFGVDRISRSTVTFNHSLQQFRTMAAPDSLPALLESLTQSLASAQEVTPKIAAIDHQDDGISLLDVKNELLFSYLQNLVFLILLKLRNAKDDSSNKSKELDEQVRSKLIELRLFLEKGARPLEEKLKFSIERFLSQARDSQQEAKANGKTGSDTDSSSDSDSASEHDDAESEDESVDDAPPKPVASGSSKRPSAPRFAAMLDDTAESSLSRDVSFANPSADGVYRAPKRERALMDTTASSRRDPKSTRKPLKSSTMDEFIASELSGAPLAEPSVGTTIVQGGRKMKTASERKDEVERQEYEENNFTRLPKESKKDKRAKSKAEGRSGRMQFGGEEWHNLGEGVDRIDRLTKSKNGGKGANVRAMLEKSRKRGVDTSDGPRGSGEMGERYQKRLKVLEGGRRDRGSKR